MAAFGPGPARLKLTGVDSDVKIAVSMGSYGFPCFYCDKKGGHQGDGSFVQLQEIRIKGNSFAYIVTCYMPSCFHKGVEDASEVEKAIKVAPMEAGEAEEKCTIS
jgi:hypothetical protein